MLPVSLRLMTNFPVELYFAGKKRAGTVTFRDKLYRFLDSPTSSIPAAAFGFFILIVSLSSVISFGVDSTRQAISLTSSLEDAMKEQDLDETEIRLLNSTTCATKVLIKAGTYSCSQCSELNCCCGFSPTFRRSQTSMSGWTSSPLLH